MENPFKKFWRPEKEELSSAELREKLRDPSYLPTHEDIAGAFKEAADPYMEWKSFCENESDPVFEFLNEEFLESFSDYLSQRVESLGASANSPVTILEVGAGNGRLSHFLQEKLEAKLPGKVKVVASDSGEWNLKTAFPVEKIGHKDALEKYQPKIVVFSWMPYGEDVTDDFRSAKSVEEYILIGESGWGACGDEWRTWGLSESFLDEEDERDEEIAPYIADGFEKEYLKDIGKNQICRSDFPGYYDRSSTASFKRKKL